MNKKLCVYTCITGNYDDLHEIENPEDNIDYLCFTNNKCLQSKTWKVIYIENGKLDNHRLSRKIKTIGHPIISDNYDISVWMDASVIWHESISQFVSKYLKNKPFAAFKHHVRNSIQQEALACLEFRKDTKENILKTLSFLQSSNFPDNLGLYEMTVFIKKHNDPKVIETMKIWFDMIQNYSKRDQLSFMYAIWQTNLQVSPIKLNVWHNSWFSTVKHTPTFEIADCHVYYGDSNQELNIEKYYVYPYRKQDNFYTFNAIIPHDTKEIEFNPTGAIGIYYDDLKITPTPDKITISESSQSIFCGSHPVIKAYYNFRKNQKLSFSIYMEKAKSASINQLIESLWAQNNQLTLDYSRMEAENRRVCSENERLLSDIQKITNSKTWRAINKVKKIASPLKRR